MKATVLIGDCIEQMRTLDAESVQCCVTSPPYWGLRDYGHEGQFGLEATPREYVARMVEVCREVSRVLLPDGTLWLNLGDSYITNIGQAGRGGPPGASSTLEGNGHRGGGPKLKALRKVPKWTDPKSGVTREGHRPNRSNATGLKNKDLALIPARVSIALQDDGWWVRSIIIWAKPNPMPESTADRPTQSHEYVILLAKSAEYLYDAAAIAERAVSTAPAGNTERKNRGDAGGINDNRHQAFGVPWSDVGGTRNARSVWTIAPTPYAGAHFATMPEGLARRCILAGSAGGDLVLDPFTGSGTTGAVALKEGRGFIGCELNPEYAALAEQRMRVTPGFVFEAAR